MVCIRNQAKSIPATATIMCNASEFLNSFFEIISRSTARNPAKVDTKTVTNINTLLESCTLACSLIWPEVVIEKLIQLIIIMPKLKVSQLIIKWVSPSRC